jgi:hypothetical protein
VHAELARLSSGRQHRTLDLRQGVGTSA